MTAGQETQTVSVDGRTARALRTREAIVDACIALVDEGVLSPTAPRIAERAGVSVRSVFQHFDDLETLFAMVAERVVGQFGSLLTPIDPTCRWTSGSSGSSSERRALLEAMTPIRRAAAVHAPFSPEIQSRLQAGHDFLRAELTTVFAKELASVPAGGAGAAARHARHRGVLVHLGDAAHPQRAQPRGLPGAARPDAADRPRRDRGDVTRSVTHRLTSRAAVVLVAALVLGLGACGDGGRPDLVGRLVGRPHRPPRRRRRPRPPTTTAPRERRRCSPPTTRCWSPRPTPHPVEVDPADPCAALPAEMRARPDGDLAWVTAAAPTDRSPVTVYVVDAGTATPALVVDRESRAEYASARVDVADLDGEPGDELVVGLRNAGTGGLLQIDIVGPAGEVAAHVTLDQGRAALEEGALRTWAARYLPDDPNCCPSRFQQAVVGVADGRWMSYAEREVTADEVPEGDFPAG